MPNWCSTTMTVKGDPQELKQFLDGIAKTDEGIYKILDTYYPCPQELKDTVAGFGGTEEQQLERGLQQAENVANHGFTDWYSWCNENWGTKWGDCNTELTCYTEKDAIFQLESAWSPITTGLEEVSKQFPNLYFILEHDEEAGFYMGIQVVKNGITVYESMSAPNEDYEGDMDDYDDYCEWKDERMSVHAQDATEFLSTVGVQW